MSPCGPQAMAVLEECAYCLVRPGGICGFKRATNKQLHLCDETFYFCMEMVICNSLEKMFQLQERISQLFMPEE